MPTPDKIDQLYDALKADGAVSKSRENFRNYMLARGEQGYRNRKQLYDALKADGAVTSATYEEFSNRLGLHAVKPQSSGVSKSSSGLARSTAKRLDSAKKSAFSQATSGGAKPQKPQPKPQKVKQQPKKAAWKPTWQEKMGMQMQFDETTRQLKQSQQDFNTRMENIRKGNTLGKTSEVKFNPKSGKMERRYYTTHGDEVATPLEQSRLNMKYRDEWEATTEEGRRHRERRIQNDFERRVGASLDKYDLDNAAAMVWQQAEDKSNEEFGRYLHERSKPSLSNFIRGVADGMNVTGGLGADNVDTGTKAFATHLKYHDLQRMADDAWNMLGKEKQQSIIEDMYGALKNRYPQATEQQLQQAATEMAREQSDRRMYELAVAKNAPKDAAEYFIRKVAAGNAMGTLMQAAARAQAGTTGDWEAREDAEQRFEKQGHKVAGIAGTVTGFALDPLTWASAGAGGAAVKGTTWLGGKMIGEAAMRKFGTTLGGRMLGGAIGGAVNFGTYEAGSEALDQMKWGGYIDEETGERKDGFSFGNVLGRAGHGLMMGAVTGVIAPYLGNVSDKLVRATESTVGKMGIRAGELGVGTVAEGTIFAVPEIIDTYGKYGELINSLSDENSPNYIADEQERAAKIEELRNSRGDALMDVWTDNMAMIAGFKAQHLLKSAPRVIYDLARSKNGKAGFETRLRSILDGRGDLALTEDEKKELERGGYGDLKDLTEEYSRYAEAKEEYDKARPTTTDASRMIEGGDGQAKLPYNRFVELMTDNSVSEAARAKMYYYLTGHGLPMSTVMGSSVLEDKDADGNVIGYTVQSFGANGVITSRSFGDKKRADVEVNRINRQAELNGLDVGERYFDRKGDYKRMEQACKEVAKEIAGVNVRFGENAYLWRRLYELMQTKPEDMSDVERKVANKIFDAYDKLGDEFDYEQYTYESNGNIFGVETKRVVTGSKKLREDINHEFGVDIDKAVKKEPFRRSGQEQKAVEEYAKRLFADVKFRQEEAARNSQTAALLGFDDSDPADPSSGMSAPRRRGYNAGMQERRDIAIELADPNNADNPDVQEAWNGVVQRINEDAAYIAALDREQAKQMQHSDGSIRPATLKEADDNGNPQQVYIVDGNVQMMPDGSMVDKASSDNIVVVYNPATGERKQIDPSADTGISSLGEVTTAEQREADIERSRQEYVQSQIDEAQGTVRLAPGQQIVLPTGEEAVVQALFDDGSAVVNMGDGTIRTVDIKELQRIRDEKAAADYRQRHGITEEPATQQPEASTPAQPQADGRVAGAPADYTADMELTIRDEDGSEKPAMVMGRVRYENGSFVPDANGNIIEYFMDGEVKHDHEDKLASKVESHVAPQQPEAETTPTTTEPQAPQTDEERVIREGIADIGEGLRDAVNEQAAGVRENDINNWLRKPSVADAMRKYGEGAQSVEEVVQRALADNPNEETKAALGDIMRFDSSKQLVQGYISQPQPAQPGEAPAQPAEQPTAEPMPVREDGEEDWQATTPERAHAYIFNEAGLSRSEGNEFIAAQTQAAQSALVKAKSAQMPRVGTSIKKYNEAKAKRQEKIDEAQRVLDYWQQVRNIQNDIQRVENERRAAEDAVRHDKAVAEAQAEYEARKQAEAERKAVGNENPMPAITEKWNNATKVDGHRDEIMLPDGTPLKGHYVLHESGASSPSHNPETWQKTDGFPMDANDNSVNDRDYERDKEAQEHTQSIARQYDQRALQSVPVVSNDGVVLSGNGRTMAGELAARDNTDGAYVNYLKEYAPKFGFTAEQVGAMQHPRVSFVPDEAMPYTAETFAKFNQQEMKSQNKTEQAVKLGKTVSDDSFKGIVRTINGYDTLGDFYNDAWASLGAVYDLHDAGVVPQAQLAEMVDGIRGQEKLSAVGREFLENMLIGKAFESDPEVVRMLTAEPAMRQTVITALGEIVDNIALGGDWSLQGELADAVKLCFDARQDGAKYGEIVSTYARQGVLFADPDELQTVADFNNATMLMLADVLNDKRVTLLKTTLQLYNNNARQSASGQTDLFAGGIQSREDILRDVITFINENYGKRKEIEAARAAAVERRKAESVQQDGAPPAVNNGSEDTGRSERSEASVERQGDLGTQVNVSDTEFDEDGSPFVLSSNGSTVFGEIREETNLTPAPIKLSLGNSKYGRVHLEKRHGEQIRNAGFNSIEEFVEFVATNYKRIRVGENSVGEPNGTYLLQLEDDHNNTLYIELSTDNSYWSVNSGGVFRKGYGNNKEEVWSASEEQNKQSATDNTSRAADKSDNPTTPNGNVSNSSEGKGSENSATVQEKTEKVAENQTPNAVQAALTAAEQETNTEPTEAQKEAGNYKKGHVKIDGYDVTIENPKGSVRRGTDASGKQWEQEMQNTYGYIRGTEGVDGDHIDVFFSEDPSQGDVFVVDQVNKDGSFDEHKVMYGFPDIESARKAYLSNYEDGWQGLGAITPVSKEEFKKWIRSSHRKTKPFAEYSSVKPLGDTGLGEQPAASYSIEPTTYTNKKGKTTPMHLVTFGRELSKEEIRAGKELAKESRGWWDREKSGFMMRDEDSAKALAEALSNEEAVQDAQPLSVADVATATDQADMKAVDETIKVEQEPQTTPQYDYDREDDVYDKTLRGLRNVLNNRKRGAIPNIKSIENVIRDLRKRAKTIEDGMATAAGETIPQAFDALANLNGKRRAYEQFLVDIRKKMAETERDDALAAHGVKLGDKIMYKGKEATIHNADARQVTLDVGLAPVLYEVTDWKNVEVPKREPATPQPKKVNVESLMGELNEKGEAKLSDHTEEQQQEESTEQPKQEEKKAKSKWVDDADAERFEELRRRLRMKLGGQLNMGLDPEAFAIGVEMSYLMLKHGARKFGEFAKNLIEALGEGIRPYVKTLYNGARDLPEMAKYEKDMTPWDEVRSFDVMNFDKEGAKDIVATAEHIVREQSAEREAKEATDKLKQERNEQRKETEHEVAANTEALASEAATVASEVESKLPSARSEREVNDLAKSIDDAIDKVNDQLALLGYYEAEPVESDFNEAYGYMRNAEKKAVRNVTESFKTLTKELGISDPVVYDTKGKKQKSVTANIAPAGGDVTMRFMLNRDKGVELYIDFMLEPDYENNRDNLVLKGIMFRPERNLPNGGRNYLRANNFFPVDVTMPQMLQGIRSVCQEWLPAEDYVAMAQRIAAKNAGNQQEKPSKERKSKKKSVSLQEQTIPDLFSGLFSEEPLKPTSNEQEVHVQPRTSTTERERGHQREQNEPLGESKQNEDERPDAEGVVRRSGNDTKSDTAGGSRVSEPSDGKRNVKPAKPEPAPLAESERKNTHNNHAERGTDYAPKGTSARIEANIKAIETMQRLIESGEPATPEDMSVLRKFSGWGGLGAAFKEKVSSGDTGYNPRLRDDYQPANPINARLRELLSPEAYEAANMSRNSAYYTPAPVIDTMWDVARAMGFRGGNVLEGSAGIGNIIGLMPTDMSERSNIHAVEIDETTGNILSLLYPDANVEVKGFEKTFVPNGSVDLAITNVPFVTGLRVMDETGDKDLSRKFHDIHDFCIAKNVRKLKEGGVGIFITSSGTLDSPNSAKLRSWLVNEGGADVVGAFRMHNQTFGGTGATSDIIVIRKRVNGRKSANAIDVSGTLPIRTVKYNTGETKRGSSEVIVKDLALDVNKHFVEHPEDMAGEMAFAFEKGDTYRATSKALYPSPSINQEQRLSEWAQQFKDMDWDKAEERESQQVVYEDLGEDVKEGSMLLDSDGYLCLAQRGKAVPINVNANKVKGHTKAECFNAYKAIKDALADVLEYQTTHSDDSGLRQRLAKLNKAYDSFVKTYGHLNKNTSISFLRSDMDYPSIAALESVSETGDKSGKRIVTYGKTDIFSRRVVETESEPKPTTIKDGIIASIYLNGRVDVPYIAEQLNMSDSDVRQQIIESGLGFENPTTTEMEVSYEYLSGNVREKLRQAQENNTDGRYDANIKALERVIPMNIPAHLIEFTLGSSWVDPKLYEDFVKERTGLDVKLTNAGGTWIMSEPYYTNTEQNRAMGVISEKCDKTIYGHELIKAAITCKSISVTKTISTGYGSSKTTETIVDKEATMACANKIDEIRQDFKDWARAKMQGDPEMSERMERVYNELFNNSVPKEIPDEFVPEHFGGAATVVNGKPFKLRPHQAKAVIRATTQPLMLAHEVGTGKTYTLISTAMEMRRLGTARKPMIVVQNATVGQFVASAKALYPNAKILTLEDADRNAEGRRNFYAKIRYNDWDMIVVPQSVFERIPDSEERQIRFIEDKVEEKMMVLEKMREAANDDRDPVLRQAQRELDQLNDELNDLKLALQERKAGGKTEKDEKREAKTRQNAMVKAQEMLDRETDDVANFDDMGIDALLIDEAHEYKHLGFATAMQRGVKGVDPSYSKKSQGVYLKTQAVLENKNGKNVVFATGTPISNTAAEIWTFMRYLMPADTMREYGIYYFDDFVRNFGNIQQMLEFATNGKYKENNRFAGYVNLPELVRIWAGVADTVLTREAGGVSDKIPKMDGEKAQDIYLPQTKALRGVMKFVKDQLDEYEKMSGKEKKENSHIPLVMYGIAKAAAVDARLVLEDAADEPNSKTNEAVRQTLRSLEDTKEYNGTIAIFADNYQNKATGFNLYEDIRKKLIDAGVPEAQVVVMKSGMSIKKKLEIFDKVNRGEVRVIMGSTFTLGTGVNIQERLHTLIHVDAPNRPMDYTQRNGRILRQGNLHNEWGIPVRVLRFGVEDSLDVTAYQRLKTKGAIADSIMEGKKMMSNSMENRVLEEEQDLFGDITAQLSGSQYALLKNQVEKEVRKLEARKKQWEADQTYVHNQKPRLKALIKDSEERAKRNKEALAKVEAAKNDGITIGKMKFPSLDAMGDYIKDYNSKQREQQEQVRTASGYKAEAKSDLTVSVGGFDFHIHRVITKEQKQEKGQLSLSFFSKTQMTYSCPELGLEDVPVDGQRLKSALEDILENVLSGDDFREKAEYAERAAERYKGELQQVEARDGKPFEYADELKQAKEKLAEYEELMKAEMAEKEAKYAEMDASVEAAKGVQLSDEEDSENTKEGDMYRDVDDDIEQDSTMQEDRDMMRNAVQQMGEKLHTDINIIEDVNEITHPNAAVQERRRKSKGWYDTATGEVNIVLANNRDVEDATASVMHETVAHKGLRELIGEEHYDEFLDETYNHLRGDLKSAVDTAAQRMFMDAMTSHHTERTIEEFRRVAVDELFGRLAEKPFEEFTAGERTLWEKLKETVRRLLDKFLGTLKLPKWFELGDNELRYILWRSKERLERGREHPIDLARDIVKREELGLTDEARYNMGDAPETFKARQRRAVENRGTVMPGLNAAQVKVVDVPRHPYTGSIKEASKQAIDAAKAKFVPNGEPKTLHYNNFGAEFDYSISGKALKESLNPKQQERSDSRGVHLAVAEHLDEVIGASIEVEEHPDYLKNEHGERDTRKVNADALMHRFYGAITVEGKSYRVMTLMREDRNVGNGVHAYEVTKIEVLDGQTTKPLSVSSRKSNTPNDSHGLNSKLEAHDLNDLDRAAKGLLPLAKLLNNLEKSYDSGKKILDESKIADESTDLYRDPEETEDIWNDQSLGLQERITAAATRLANNHRDNKTLRNDAMRAIGGNLSDLRKAMSLQRTFDMTTVKRVADLARVLMNNGYLNGLTQQEVKRLLAAVKNSVGHNDIEGDVQKVMDIMVDNQLKHAEDTLHELEAIRGSKVDARGVEVQGQLDPAGAHTMKVFKKTRGWEKTDIEEAISEAQLRMGSSDVAVADEAALEYTGLQLALEYAENIKDSKVEERKLRDEIKQAHDDASERDRATDSYRQYIASLQEAIRQNKIERAQSYFDLVGRLTDSLRESIANAKDFKEAEKQRIREIQHNANSDMEGRPSDEHYKPTFADKFVNNSFVSFLFAPLATFDQMLRMFGGKSANGEGYLYNRFMRGWVDARQKEINGVRDKYAILDRKAAELFGGKVKTWGDLIRRVGKLPKGTVSFWNGGEMQERELTQGNLMYIYMVNKMLDGRMKLRKMGITEENVADIEEVLDPRLIELADWLQDEFLVQTRNEYNETHKRMFGASMAAIEHYFPLKILANARADKPEDLDNPDKSDGISTATGSIIKRRRNALALDITGADALSVILDHVAQMEHWNAFAEFNRDINTLRTYKRFRNQVQNMTTIYGSGKELWKKFNDVCQMAAGTYRPPRTKLDEAAVNFAKGVTAAKVSFRMFTALKQFLSMPAYIPEARTDYLLRNIANPVGAWKWSMEHLPIFNERWRSRMSGDPRLLKSDMDWKMWRTRIMQLASRAGMSPNAFVDALTVSIGAHSMYQTRLAQYLRDGYSEADAEKKAVQDAEVLYNQTQQSSEGAFTSTMQVDRSWLSVLFTVFRNASMSYQRQLHDAFRNFKHNLTPGGRARSIEFMKKQYVRDGIDEAQAEQNAKRKFRRQLLKDTLRVATFGYIMQLAWNLGAYLPYLLFGDDEDEKQKMWDDVWAHTTFGSVEGLTGGDLMSQAGQMMLTGEGNPAYLSKDMPLTSDVMTAFQKLGNGQHTEAFNDIVNIVVQAGIGVNPQSITDTVLAIMDACGDDPALAHEAIICVFRILQVPQSQIDKMYFDEVGLSGANVSKYSIEDLVRRYAAFKLKRGRFSAPWSWNDTELEEKYMKKGEKIIRERVSLFDDNKLQEKHNTEDIQMKKIVGKEAAKRLGGTDSYGSPQNEYGQVYLQMRDYVDLAEDVTLQTALKNAKERGDTDRVKDIESARRQITEVKKDLADAPYNLEDGTKVTAKDIMQELRELRKNLMDELGITTKTATQ